ncbi:hypothetical protein AURDEDRAFT_160827 [Auricularia subglabra TFB-10046 SS5]|nr:hypothetical protein AURDEDRAFT_160827 [Auricularia subglabra TFB-10046 SS5]
MVQAFEFGILALLSAVVCASATGAQVKMEEYAPIRQEGEAAAPRTRPGMGYVCPSGDAGARPLVSFATGDDTFSCTFATGSCTYQTKSGDLIDDANDGDCVGEAEAARTNEAGNSRALRRKRNILISSRQLQEMVIRNIL